MIPANEAPFLPSGLGLALVLGLILCLAWGLRRLRPRRRSPDVSLSLLGQLAVGPKEKVVVVAIDGDWLVLGVAPGRVSLLALGDPESTARPASDTDAPLGPLDTIERSAAFRAAFGVAKAKCQGKAPAPVTTHAGHAA